MSQDLLTLIRAAETAADVARDAHIALVAANETLADACPVKVGDSIDAASFPPDETGTHLAGTYTVQRVTAFHSNGVAWFGFTFAFRHGDRRPLFVSRLAVSFVKE